MHENEVELLHKPSIPILGNNVNAMTLSYYYMYTMYLTGIKTISSNFKEKAFLECSGRIVLEPYSQMTDQNFTGRYKQPNLQ